MKLSSPGEMDEPTGESSGKQSASGEKLRESTVSLFGEEMPMAEGVELIGEMVDNPEAFGIASESMVREAGERVEELEAENERLRRDLAVLWEHVSVEAADGRRAIPVGDDHGVGPESVDVYDPTEEFE